MKKMGARERLLAAAEEARKALLNPEPEPTDPAATPATGGGEPTPATPEATPTPPAEPTPAPAASAAENAALKAENTRLTAALDDENNPTWKQRYSSLQGMFNHQGEELKTIKAEIAELKAKPATPAPEPADSAEDPEYVALVEEVGETAAKIIMARDAKSKKQLDEALSAVNGELASAKGEAKTATEKAAAVEQGNAYDRFYGGLSEPARKYTAPDANGYLQDQEFAQYLSEKVPGTPYTRAQAYGEFAQGFDASGINELVAEFEKATGKAASLETPQTPSQRAEGFVEPGKTASGTKDPDDKPEMIKESEVDSFHDSVRRRTFKGTSQEMATLLTKYKQAGIEGRILYDQ